MKLYRTKTYLGNGRPVYSWQGTQADAASERKRIRENPAATAETKDIDVPTDKPSLLAWLNANVTGE